MKRFHRTSPIACAFFYKFSAIHRRKVARATRSLEITGSSVGVLGEEAYALAAGGLSGQAMPLPGRERRSFQGRCTHPSGRAALARHTPVPVLGYGQFPVGQGERQFPVTVVPQTCSYCHSSLSTCTARAWLCRGPPLNTIILSLSPSPAWHGGGTAGAGGVGCAVARLAASARTTLSSARTSHRPRSLVTLMAKRFSTPRTDRKNASRLRARSFEASHTTHSDSRNTVAAAQFSALHARSRRTSSSERGGRIALKDLLVVMLY